MSHQLTFREELRPSDPAEIRHIIESTGFFHDYEIDVAVDECRWLL